MKKEKVGIINQRIREYRLAKKLTLSEMAKRCNLTKGYLSKVERGEKSPPVPTLQIIATSLNMDIAELFDDLLTEGNGSSNIEIVHKGNNSHGVHEFDSSAGYTYKPLLASFKNKYMAPYLMRVQPGKTETFTHDSEEFGYLIEGEVELHYCGAVYKLSKGDSYYFSSREEHRFVNHKQKTAVLVTVNFNYKRF